MTARFGSPRRGRLARVHKELAGVAVTEGVRSDRALLVRALPGIVSVTVLIEFVANLYAFPFAVEVLAAPVIFGFLLAEKQGPIQAVVLIYAYFSFRALGDLDGFLTQENAEDFLVGPVLTIALIPFLLAMAHWSRHEQRNLRRRFSGRLGHSLYGRTSASHNCADRIGVQAVVTAAG